MAGSFDATIFLSIVPSELNPDSWQKITVEEVADVGVIRHRDWAQRFHGDRVCRLHQAACAGSTLVYSIRGAQSNPSQTYRNCVHVPPNP